MKARTSVSLPTPRIVVAGISVIALCVSLAVAQKENATERQNRLANAVLAQAPEKARIRKNPFEGDAEALAAGQKLFGQHCVECHGQNAGGTKYGANLLRQEVQQATPGTLFWILTNGVVRHGMPVWSKLPEPERWQIVTFLKSLKSQPMKSQSLNLLPEDAQP
jgi:mono/diheme cytochrome c family protein